MADTATALAELVKEENKFLEEFGAETNEHGVYIYESRNKNHIMNLPFVLRHYRDWLVENGILTEKL